MSFSSNKVKPNNISIDGSQTISNKVLDASNDFSGDIIDPARSDVKKGTQAELETYAASATNGQLCFATDTKLMYQVLDSALVSVGSGSAAINYIANPDLNIDVSDITGDTNLVISQETVAPLRGAGSLKIAKGAIDASTQSVLIDMNPVDTADLAKKLTISFDIDASDVNYKDGDAQVRIIKDPAGTPVTIRVNGEDIKGGKNTHIAQFQTDHTEVDYALEIYWADTGVLATELIIDNIQVGPREVVKGAAMTDWKEYTPTTQGLGTVANLSSKYRRVGDSIEISIHMTTGTTTASEAQIGLPSGLSIDSNYNAYVVGEAQTRASNETHFSVLATSGDVYFNIGSRASGTDGINSPKNGNALFGSSVYVSFNAKVKIVGWSSNAVSSEDLGGREIVVEAYGNSGEAIAANSEDMTWKTIVRDTTGSWIADGTTGSGTADTFLVPETGDYDIDLSYRITASLAPAIFLYIDGVDSGENLLNSGVAKAVHRSSALAVRLLKGQKLTFRTSSTMTMVDAIGYNRLRIAKRASPQTILETETVAARYTSNNGQSTPNGATIEFEDIDYDTHNAYNISTGEYTVPASGKYHITSKIITQSQSWSSGHIVGLTILINGVELSQEFTYTSAMTSPLTASVADSFDLKKGDLVEINIATNISTSLGTDSRRNTFSIHRIK